MGESEDEGKLVRGALLLLRFLMQLFAPRMMLGCVIDNARARLRRHAMMARRMCVA